MYLHAFQTRVIVGDSFQMRVIVADSGLCCLFVYVFQALINCLVCGFNPRRLVPLRERERDRDRDRETETDRQTDRQTVRQSDRQSDRQTDR